MKVLIADTDWRFTEQATQYLESHADLVVHQPHARAALSQIEHWQPDVVILAAEQASPQLLTSILELKGRPAVLLTGWMDRYDKVWRAWQVGGDELLIKPVMRSEELRSAIVTALENAAAGTRKQTRQAVAS